MDTPTDPFYFDKTDLFKKIKNIEGVLGLGSFNIEEVATRLDSIENTLNAINTSYTTKTYVDNRLLSKVSKSGDSMLGNLALLTTPIDNNHVVTKQYVNDLIAEINGLDLSLIATKTYVDSKVAEIGQVDTSLLATKLYVDNELGNKISKFGDILYGELILSDNATQPMHPVTKQQFDSTLDNVAITGNLDW
jgi:hypothetical protein